MKNLKTRMEDFLNESSEFTKTPEEVVSEYTEKYNDYGNFFNDFIERFPNRWGFDERLWDYFDEDDDEEDDFEEGDDEVDSDYSEEEARFDRLWSPEAEVNMIECEVGMFPNEDVWCDFFNDLCDTEWGVKKNPHDEN